MDINVVDCLNYFISMKIEIRSIILIENNTIIVFIKNYINMKVLKYNKSLAEIMI